MEAYIVDWLNLLARWLHFITGIAWIGASFYFIWLDNHLETPRDPGDTRVGVGGEVWSVHGGGFYHAQKYKVAPPFIPETLHWFKWEAYSTWLSGMFLLALVYWYGAQVYLIDPSVAELSPAAAVGLAAGILVIGLVVYDLLCRSPLGNNERVFAIVLFALVGILARLEQARAGQDVVELVEQDSLPRECQRLPPVDRAAEAVGQCGEFLGGQQGVLALAIVPLERGDGSVASPGVVL